MRAWLFLVVVAVGCRGHESDVAALQQHIAVLEIEVAKAEGGTAKLGDHMRDIDDRMPAGAHWWCAGVGSCARTETDCKYFAGKETCALQRVAFCGGVLGTNCFGSLNTCTTVTSELANSTDKQKGALARMCIGVE